jgi:peptidoglycan/xylan/chitin deacetylase (PgdA/CDA1 family)
MSVRSRGAAGTAARTRRVLSRFGATAGAMSAHLARFAAIAGEQDAHPTWPTTACVLARHPRLLRGYAERGAELAVHGLVHGDHAALGERQQRDTIARALDIFDRAGLRPTGFRGPYLRYNDATLDVLRALGFRYHSSQAIVFPPRDAGAAAARSVPSFAQALRLYSARDARVFLSLPRVLGGIVDIPVAIPDDEIIVERMQLDSDARADEWRHILELTNARGELFTLQLHPERVPELGPALASVLAEARRLGVWVATLDEVASWWMRRSRFRLCVMALGGRRYRIRLEGDPDAVLVARGVPRADGAVAGQDLVVELDRAPMVGISPQTADDVRARLREDGIPSHVSSDAAAYGAWLDRPDVWTETDVFDEIERSTGPLVRIARWPGGARSALAITGDIDALTIKDFVLRSWETRAQRVTQGEQG